MLWWGSLPQFGGVPTTDYCSCSPSLGVAASIPLIRQRMGAPDCLGLIFSIPPDFWPFSRLSDRLAPALCSGCDRYAFPLGPALKFHLIGLALGLRLGSRLSRLFSDLMFGSRLIRLSFGFLAIIRVGRACPQPYTGIRVKHACLRPSAGIAFITPSSRALPVLTSGTPALGLRPVFASNTPAFYLLLV